MFESKMDAHVRSGGRLCDSPAWKALQAHYDEIAPRAMRDMFAADPKRFERFTLRFDDMLFDYSKNRIDETTMGLLVHLAEDAGVPEAIGAMFAGEKINWTEKRAVLPRGDYRG